MIFAMSDGIADSIVRAKSLRMCLAYGKNDKSTEDNAMAQENYS